MLSNSELGYLYRIRERNDPDAFLEENDLRSRASKSQQLRIYGYWRRGKVAIVERKAKGACAISHSSMDVCLTCSEGWGIHSGHACPRGFGIGEFPNCREAQ